MPKIRVTVGQQNKATVPKIFQTVAYLLCEILSKISHSLFYLAEGLSQQTDKSESQNNEAVRPFEPQRGSTLVERPHYSAGNTAKQSDAITL